MLSDILGVGYLPYTRKEAHEVAIMESYSCTKDSSFRDRQVNVEHTLNFIVMLYWNVLQSGYLGLHKPGTPVPLEVIMPNPFPWIS